MDRNILRQYLSGLAGANNRFLLENSRALGNLPQNIVYNGLLYTLNLRENAFINQFGHRIDASAAPAFITEARAFEQQNVVALDLSSASSDSSSSRPQPESGAEKPTNVKANPDNTKDPTTGVIVTFDIDDSTKADSFILYRATDSKGPFTQVKTDPNRFARAFVDEGLTPGTTYYYEISSVLAGKEGEKSSVVTVTTDSVKPPIVGITAPNGLTATTISQNAINLSWTDNSTNELGFYLYQSLNGSAFSLIEGLAAGSTTASVKGLSQDNNYWYRVQAYATGSTSAFSNTINIRTLPTLPAAPTGLSLLVGGTSQISLSWTDNSTNEQYFNIFQTTDGGSSYVLGATVGANSTAYIATGLSAGTTYGFRVNAANTGGTSGFAGPAFAKTISTIPSAPSNLGFTSRTASALVLQWTDNSSNEDGFLIQSSPTGVTYTDFASVGANVTGYESKGLNPGTTYFFRVAAFNDGGTAFSGATSWQTLPLAPSIPTGFAAVVGSSANINLSWNDVANETGYELYRSLNGSSYTLLTTLGAGVTVFNNTGLNAATTYWYRLNAFNIGGTSDFTSAINATTLPEIPAVPSFTSISGTTNSITLNWSNVANETGYNLYRSVTLAGSYTGIATLGANVVTYTDSGLPNGSTFFYKIDAFNSGGTSALSGATSFVTQGVATIPTAPSALAAYSSVPETKNFLRYTEGFTTSVSQANGGWAGTSTTVSIDNSVLAPDGSTGAALLTVTSPAVIGGINSSITEPGITAGDYWSGSVWLRGKTATCGGINIVIRDAGNNQLVIPSTLKVLSGPGTLVTSSVGETHWNGITGLSKTEWTRIAWNNLAPWGPTGLPGTYTGAVVRLTVNFYDGAIPSAVTGDSIYVWGAQYERNAYPTAYLAATGGSFSTRAFQGFTSQANLYWTDNSNNEAGFLIERSTNDVTYAGVTSVAANTTIYSDSGLSAGSTYFYRVSAFNAGGTSATTKSPSITTFPNPPATPSFTSISGTTNSITLNWNNVANETGYGLYRSTTLAGTYTGITTLGANVTTFVNTGLTSGDTFFYKIDAFNSGGTSALSGATSFTTLVTPVPTAPSNLRFTNITSSRISIAWNDNSSNETGFVIQDSLAGVTYNTLDTVGIGVTNYESRGLSAGTTYYFRVAAFNSGGTSAFAGPTFTKTYSETLPEVPDFNANAFGEDTIVLDWGWTGDPATIDGFELLVGNSPLTGLTNVSSDVRGYIHTGLTKGLTYTYEIRAYQSTNYSPPVNTKYKLGIVGPIELSPNDPVGFTASSISTDQINLSWTAPTPSAFYGSATGYQIYRTETGKGYRIVASTTGATFYAMTGLTQDVFYEFKILAYNSGGPSGLTGPISSRTRPPAPTGLTAVSGSTSQINLFWNGFTFRAPASSFYNIYRSIDNSTFNLSATAAASATSYINLGLSAGTTYWYKLAAQNSGGTSTFSGTAFAITQEITGGTPSAPTGFTATDAGINSVTLQWTDTATNEDGFLLYYRGLS